ncbi:PF20097 family protein [Luteolibacter flavescens]|uniref:PF20097 family protein n=1 Tax=Luteolibacter flavescens TaxID=1859460 RepID=A0ABT3FNC4_9BACT|nr:PF20097 family protein [Luteolibacter flavescens]MCW1884962.1 PF20097 family protein [Luteolibacter flavescens]
MHPSPSRNDDPASRDEHPYAPPLSLDEPSATQGPPCPKCLRPMHVGQLRSSSRITWAGDDERWIIKAFFGGTPVGKITTGIGCRHRAFRCADCRLYILDGE